MPTAGKVKSLPRRIDVASLTKAAASITHAELAGIRDEAARLNRAVKIVAEVEGKLEPLRERRDALAVSLSVYDGVRAVNTMAGLGRTQMSKIKRAAIGGEDLPLMPGTSQTIDKVAYRALAERHGVPHYPDAASELPAVAAQVVTLTATQEAAREVRDEIALGWISKGVKTKTEVAKIMGVDRSRIAHLLSGARNTAA